MTLPDAPPLAGTLFDRAAHRRHDEDWLAEAWTRAHIVPVTPESTVPVVDGRVVYGGASSAPDGTRRFLGIAGGIPYFTVSTTGQDGWQTLREFGGQGDDLDTALVVAAIGLEQWHLRHRFCPRCGSPTVETQAGWTRTCTNDGSVHFPRTDPAVIMLVHDGADLVLLGRNKQWAAGRFSTLAGFVEPGESLETAVAREVFEEVGVGVSDVRYVGSQPWPFPASLMVGFTARLAGEPGITLDPVEMAEAGWFTRAEIEQAADWTDTPEQGSEAVVDPASRLRAIPPHFSIARYLIDSWLARRIP